MATKATTLVPAIIRRLAAEEKRLAALEKRLEDWEHLARAEAKRRDRAEVEAALMWEAHCCDHEAKQVEEADYHASHTELHLSLLRLLDNYYNESVLLRRPWYTKLWAAVRRLVRPV